MEYFYNADVFSTEWLFISLNRVVDFGSLEDDRHVLTLSFINRYENKLIHLSARFQTLYCLPTSGILYGLFQLCFPFFLTIWHITGILILRLCCYITHCCCFCEQVELLLSLYNGTTYLAKVALQEVLATFSYLHTSNNASNMDQLLNNNKFPFQSKKRAISI